MRGWQNQQEITLIWNWQSWGGITGNCFQISLPNTEETVVFLVKAHSAALTPIKSWENIIERSETCELLEFVLVRQLHVILVCAQPGGQNAVPLYLMVGAFHERRCDFLCHPGRCWIKTETFLMLLKMHMQIYIYADSILKDLNEHVLCGSIS